MLRRGIFIGAVCVAFFASGWFMSEACRYEPLCKVTVRPQGTETTWYFHSPETCRRKKCDIITEKESGCNIVTALGTQPYCSEHYSFLCGPGLVIKQGVVSKCISHTGEGAKGCCAGR